jgi:dihydrofolate reductase
MGQIIVFAWTSIDGVFDADLMNEWWDPFDSVDRQRVIQETYADSDAFLMGRITYELLAPFWSTLPDDAMAGVAGTLANTRKYVATTRGVEPKWKNTTPLAMAAGDITASVRDLKQRSREIVVIGSAALVGSLLSAGLVDELKMLVQPVIVGRGRRFFANGVHAQLNLVEAGRLDRGVALMRYASS